MANSKRQVLMGVPIDLLTMDEAVAVCLQNLDAPGRPLQIVTANAELFCHTQRLAELQAVFRGHALIVPDGISILAAGQTRGWPVFARVPGIDLCLRLLAAAASRGVPVFLYGGRPGIALRAAAAVRLRHPGLMVAGTAHGYLPQAEIQALPGRIAASGAKMLLAGLGMPRQEIWLWRHLAQSGALLGMGVGGSLDVIAGRLRRAPVPCRSLGLEWLYRVWQEPRRLRRLRHLPGTIWRMLK